MGQPLQELEIEVTKKREVPLFLMPFVWLVSLLANTPLTEKPTIAFLNSAQMGSDAMTQVIAGSGKNLSVIGSIFDNLHIVIRLVYALLLGILFYKILKFFNIK